MRLLLDQYLYFGNKAENPTEEYVVVFKLKHNYTDIEYLKNNGEIEIQDAHGKTINILAVRELVDRINIEEIYRTIKGTKGSSFLLPKVQEYFELLKISSFKGSSYSKHAR